MNKRDLVLKMLQDAGEPHGVCTDDFLKAGISRAAGDIQVFRKRDKLDIRDRRCSEHPSMKRYILYVEGE